MRLVQPWYGLAFFNHQGTKTRRKSEETFVILFVSLCLGGEKKQDHTRAGQASLGRPYLWM